MQFDPNAPIWLQIMTAIKADIAAGRMKPGEKLPGGRELAVSYSVNPNTAARVYQELEKEGLCGTRRGMGTFVTEDTERIEEIRNEMIRGAVHQFLRKMEDMGVSPEETARVLGKEIESGCWKAEK